MGPSELPLRDIHLPEPIGWWPLAPGWWIVMVLVCFTVGLVLWWMKRRQVFAAKRRAIKDFNALVYTRDLSPKQQIESLSVLLRRVCISEFSRQQVAGLTGNDWLNFLDRQLNDGRFTNGVGKLLVEAPYLPNLNCDLDPLFKLCDDWLKTLPGRQK